MQAYSTEFARVYNMRWAGFATQVAPRILEFYERTPLGGQNTSVLDLCCGTGQLARHFLDKGYRVTGVDSSEGMLNYARENVADGVADGRAKFIQADAAGFTLDECFGLVVSTYDALNHLDDADALRRCFQSVFAVLAHDGTFIFDLNTRAALAGWNSIAIEDTEEMMLVSRGIYDVPNNRATIRISGFVRTASGCYERFEETAYNTAFDMEMVRQALLDTGWREVHFARSQDLAVPILEPENERRVFIVARK
ncbi:MAG: class I SAM-dependent methyltransferase [Chloroflexi bacterium]|nr:class I SAM-dependent methyltransferase [Chloroflexota bacterium]